MLHSMPGARGVTRSDVNGPARVSTIVGLNMKAKLLSRAVVVFVAGIAMGLWWHRTEQRHYLQGKDAFISEQQQRWDRFYTHPHHLLVALVVGFFLAIVVFGFYDLLVAGLSRLFGGASANDKRS